MTRLTLTLEDASLLRGVSHFAVLRHFGKLLTSSAGQAGTYELSQTTESLQAFLSHNWSTPRWVKFIALCFHFNHRMASAAAVAACVVGFALTCSGVLPTYGMNYFGGTEDKAHYCTLLSLVTYWIVLLTYQDAALRTGRKGTRVFLDKCCIHQTDERLKQKGIEQLGAFLAKADTMLIIYSDLYTKKLWTMYELATFLAIRGPSHLVVVPAFLASMIPKAYACAALYALISEVLSVDGVADHAGLDRSTTKTIIVTIALPLVVAATWLFRWWAHEQRIMLESTQNFNYANATCFVESDRELVNGNIARYMRDLSMNQGYTDEVALEAFNSLVSAEVPAAVTKSLGPLGLPTRYRLIISMPAVALLVDSTAAALKAAGDEPRCASAKILSAAALCALWPVSFTLMSWLTKRFLWVNGGPLEWLLIFGFAAICGGHQLLFFNCVIYMRGRALEGAMWAFAVLALLLSFFVFILWKTHTSAYGGKELDAISSESSSEGSRIPRLFSRSRSNLSKFVDDSVSASPSLDNQGLRSAADLPYEEEEEEEEAPGDLDGRVDVVVGPEESEECN